MLVTDEQVRSHLRIDASGDVAVYVGAAQRLAIEFLNRKVYEDETAMAAAVSDGTAGEHPMVVDDLVRTAILLILGHLYTNREDVVVGVSVDEIPMGSLYLLQPYRKCMGV